MSAKVMSGEAVEAKAAAEGKSSVAVLTPAAVEVESAKCDCCGLTEDCTTAYIARVRDRFDGRWVCGLCAEAVSYEVLRSGRRISTEEALVRHVAICKAFRSAPPPTETTERMIAAFRTVLRRSLDSPRTLRSTPTSPSRDSTSASGGSRPVARPSLARSESCFPALAR